MLKKTYRLRSCEWRHIIYIAGSIHTKYLESLSSCQLLSCNLFQYPNNILLFLFFFVVVFTFEDLKNSSSMWQRRSGLANLFYKGSHHKYFMFFRPYGLCHNYSTSFLEYKSSYRQYINKWVWPYSNKMHRHKKRTWLMRSANN